MRASNVNIDETIGNPNPIDETIGNPNPNPTDETIGNPNPIPTDIKASQRPLKLQKRKQRDRCW